MASKNRYVENQVLQTFAPDDAQAVNEARDYANLENRRPFLEKAAGATYGTQMSDADIMRTVLRVVREKNLPNPNQTALKLFKTAKSKMSRASEGAAEAAGQAINEGALESTETMALTPEQAQRLEQGFPYKRTPEQARVELAKRVGKTKALNAYLDPASDPDTAKLHEQILEEDLAGTPNKDPGWGPLVALDTFPRAVRAGIGSLYSKVREDPEHEVATFETTPGLGGLTVSDLARTAAKQFEPSAAWDALKAAGRAALDPEDRTLAVQMAKEREARFLKARKAAEAQGGTPEQIAENTRKLDILYNSYNLLAESPYAAEQVLGGVVDVVNPVNDVELAVKGVGALGKAATKIPKVGPALKSGAGKAADVVGQRLESLYGIRKGLEGNPEAAELLPQLREAADVAHRQAADIGDVGIEAYHVAKKGGKDQAAVMRALEGKGPIPAGLDKAAYDALMSKQFALMKEAGAAQRLDPEGFVEAAKPIKNYVAHRALERFSLDELDKAAQAAGFKNATEVRNVLAATKEAAKEAGDEAMEVVVNSDKAIEDFVAGRRSSLPAKALLDAERRAVVGPPAAPVAPVPPAAPKPPAALSEQEAATLAKLEQIEPAALNEMRKLGQPLADEAINPKYRRAIPSAALEREGGHAVQDALLQLSKDIPDRRAKTRTASTIAGFAKVLKGDRQVGKLPNGKPLMNGLWHEVPRGDVNATDETFRAVSQMFPGVALGRATGELKNKLLTVTGAPGANVHGVDAIIMPKAVLDHFDTELNILGAKPEASMAGLGKLWNTYVTPLHNIWRTKVTIARAPVFLTKNATSALITGAINNGIHAANPKLQSAAVRTVLEAAFGGSRKALETEIKLGKKSVPLGQIYDYMRKVGMIGRGQARYLVPSDPAMSGLGKLLHGTERALNRQVSALKLDKLAGLADDYQKATTFIGYLARHGIDPNNGKAMAKALDYTSKYAGNWNRMTKFERTVMRNAMSFYSWNRFVLPWMFRHTVENPQRLRTLGRLTRIFDDYLGKQAPVTGVAIPDYLKGTTSATAPAWMQTDDPAHDFAISMVESPTNTLSQLLKDQGLSNSPGAVMALLALMSGKAPGGAGVADALPPIEHFKDPEAWKAWLNNPKGAETFAGAVPVVYSKGLVQLLEMALADGDLDEFARLQLMQRAGRDWAGMTEWVKMLSGNGRTPGVSPLPFVQNYVVNPLEQTSRRAGKARGEFETRLNKVPK